MKKDKFIENFIIVAIVALLTGLIVFAFCGCENTSGDETLSNTIHMTKCYDDEVIQIYRHEETGVYYLGGSSYRAGWCVMVNADGTPYTGENEKWQQVREKE